MKKLIVMAIAAAGVFSVQAQQDCKALYKQAEDLDKAFNKERIANGSKVSPEAAMSLLNAYDLYMQVVECEKMPDAKGKVSDALTKKIDKALKTHYQQDDFMIAGVTLYNADKHYPEAYNAFMRSGYGAIELGTKQDTVYAVDFYNAGNSAFGKDFKAAAKAYTEARKANIKDPQAYVYNIASLQNIAAQDTTYNAYADIYEIASEGVKKFGASNDYIFANYIQNYLDNNKYDDAVNILNDLATKEPTNANIYRLRAIVNNANHKYDQAIPDFQKVAELSDNFEYVRDAANNINKIAKFKMGQINNATPQQKSEIIGYFNAAMEIANKAKGLKDANGSIDSIIEDIDYNLQNANKL